MLAHRGLREVQLFTGARETAAFHCGLKYSKLMQIHLRSAHSSFAADPAWRTLSACRVHNRVDSALTGKVGAQPAPGGAKIAPMHDSNPQRREILGALVGASLASALPAAAQTQSGGMLYRTCLLYTSRCV